MMSTHGRSTSRYPSHAVFFDPETSSQNTVGISTYPLVRRAAPTQVIQ